MAKKNKSKNSRTPQTEAAATAPTGGGMHAARETIESIVIAFVLAFLFRTFEAEAFVIPTGSMSPSLQGQHKDVDCTECGYRFRTTASSEGDDRQRLIAQSRNPNLAMHQRQQLQRAIGRHRSRGRHVPHVPTNHGHAPRPAARCTRLHQVKLTTQNNRATQATASWLTSSATRIPIRSAGMSSCSSTPATAR